MELQKKHSLSVRQKLSDKGIFYEAILSSDLPDYVPKKYIGCEGTFKKRFSSHNSTFNLERYKNGTALSTKVWRVKQINGVPSIM